MYRDLLDGDIDDYINERNLVADRLAEFYKSDYGCVGMHGYQLRDEIDLLNFQICEMKIERFLLFLREYDVKEAVVFIAVWVLGFAVFWLMVGCSQLRTEDMAESYYAASAINAANATQLQSIIDRQACCLIATDDDDCDHHVGVEQSQCKKRQYPNYSY